MKRGRSNIDDSVYPLFVTTTIIDFIPVFREPYLAEQALQLLEKRRKHHNMLIYSYVLMPHHFHGIVQAPQRNETSRFMASWKSLVARLILDSAPPDWRSAFAQATRRYGGHGRKTHQVWGARFDDLALYDPDTFAVKLNYIHNNPVKAGLVSKGEDYVYSSAGYYLADRDDRFIKLTDCRFLLMGSSS